IGCDQATLLTIRQQPILGNGRKIAHRCLTSRNTRLNVVTCGLQCDRNDRVVLPRHPIGVSVPCRPAVASAADGTAPAFAGLGDHGTGPGGGGRTFWRRPRRDGGYMPGEAEADTDGHLWPIAVSRLPAAAETSRSALTVADTVLALGFEVRFDAAVWSLSSAADRALVWDCHWPWACVVSVFSFALTSARSDLISSPIPCPTWRWVRVPIEARRAAASWHTADAGLGAADEGGAEVVDGLLPLDGVPLDPQAAAS